MRKRIMCILTALVMSISILPNAAAITSEDFKDLYAVISYDANGGTGYMPNELAMIGVPFALPICDFDAPDDMEFQAWEIDGEHLSEGNIWVFESDSSTSVKAKWKSINETVSSLTIDTSQIKNVGIGLSYSGKFIVNDISEDTPVLFTINEGELPPGLSLSTDGKITGIPSEIGTYGFSVTASVGGDADYQVIECDVTIHVFTDRLFRGRLANANASVITNRSETLDENEIDTLDNTEADSQKETSEEENMYASETLDKGDGKNQAVTSPKLTIISETLDVFDDISPSLWCYGDLEWAYKSNYMSGVTATLFHPQDNISSVTAVVVLARMDGVDLTRYEGQAFPGIQGGQWYTSAANWARDKGLLPSGDFSGNKPLPRGQLAVMLVKYLRSTGILYAQSSRPVHFADAASMTQEENEAFQILYRLGIFKGTGNYTMNTKGYTTRGHLAAVLHRLSVFTG